MGGLHSACYFLSLAAAVSKAVSDMKFASSLLYHVSPDTSGLSTLAPSPPFPSRCKDPGPMLLQPSPQTSLMQRGTEPEDCQ